MKNIINELTADGQTKKTKILKTREQAQKEAAMLASVYPSKFQDSSLLAAAGYEVDGAAVPASEATGHAAPTPINNMGVKSHGEQVHYEDGTEKITVRPSGKKGHSEIIRIPQPASGVDKRVGFVDQVSFTVRVSDIIGRDLYPFYGHLKTQWTVADAVPRMSSILMSIFGFAVTHQRERGVNFYKESYTLGEGEGILSAGGQNDTINVQIYGQGCHKAKDEWEVKLKHYLKTVGGWITRIDIAADFYDGAYSVDDAERDYLDGKMSGNGRPPFAERRGDWYTGQGGRTFYVGRRTSGKLLRVYEKGLQILGTIAACQIDDTHRLNDLKNWVRVECEWHNQCRICPLDMLTSPGTYLAGSYPAFSGLSAIQDVVETLKKTVELTVEKAKQWLRHSAGKHIKTLIDIMGLDELAEYVTKGKEYAKYVATFGALLPENDPQNILWVEPLENELAIIDSIPILV